MDNTKNGFNFAVTVNDKNETYAQISPFLLEQDDKYRKVLLSRVKEWVDKEINKIDENE